MVKRYSELRFTIINEKKARLYEKEVFTILNEAGAKFANYTPIMTSLPISVILTVRYIML